MSPYILDDTPRIDRVAIIGAGPSGLAAAKYLAAETTFSQISVFEQRATPGGVWNYSSQKPLDGDFCIPRLKPTQLNDSYVRVQGKGTAAAAVEFVSPLYDMLETNIPHSLMNYSDRPFPEGSSLFPAHAAVTRYLHEYSEEVKGLIYFETQVVSVAKNEAAGDDGCWDITLRDLKTGESRREQFDAVLVGSGHYNDPFVPDANGLAEFHRAHPGVVTHSKFFKNPEEYAGKKVVVVGNSASGIDISAQISKVAALPVIVSEKSVPTATTAVSEEREWASMKPLITEFLPATRSVVFADGSTEHAVDAVIFCTGYFYSFPFLQQLQEEENNDGRRPPVVTDGSCARHLYQHVLYNADPTLAFLGIPQRVVPMPIAEAQSAWVARLWAGRLAMPSKEEMQDWEEREKNIGKRESNDKAIHNLAFPKDVAYINFLHGRSLAAEDRPDLALENDGRGKIPPYWGEDKAWARERFPLIKMASRALGDRRHEVTTLEELGFDFGKWKREAAEREEAERELI